MMGSNTNAGKGADVITIDAAREAELLADFFDTVTFVPPEADGSIPPLDPEPDDPDDEPGLEGKVRYVRTDAGVQRFDEPIGAPIVPHPRLAVRKVDTGLAERNTGAMPRIVTYPEMDALLDGWFHPIIEDAPTAPHPKSGFYVKVGVERRVVRPDDGQEGPPEWNVVRFDQTAPNRPLPDYGEDLGREPIPYVYRGMSMGEWEQAQSRGYLMSDRRGTIADWEGTNADPDPRTAFSYLPYDVTGVIVKIRVDPADKWFTIHADQYLRTRSQVPLDRVMAVSPPIHKGDRELTLPEGSALTAT